MLMAVLLDWMPSRYDGPILYTALAFLLAPRLFLSGLLITALPGILIGAFTVRKISGPSLDPNILIGAFVGTFIEIIIYATGWWPYSISKGAEIGVFWIALIFRALLPIWLMAIVTSKTINSKMESK
ncbi:hypothetical protein [Bradyrhizobium zhanjiangense]|uniref:Rod shape-determining protein MreD n=1 Tax=Bradyrhizobium zhanjiangense TaxID=1325107 RepID=A0ABY0D9C8_9BRAD|nr:hypothetical protein [Bradyrhizobium zhanjiangense]RXG86522.1 hypothetical protein EAS62_37415 [Bradyrhizobium zhanjiangense]